MSFVTRTNSQLFLGGSPFKVVGANSYTLGLNENPVAYPTHFQIDDALTTAKEMGATVVRSHTLGISTGDPFDDEADGTNPDIDWNDDWANDATDTRITLWPTNGSTNPAAFDTIDYAIYKAGQLGLKLLIPLTDNWGYYHGGLHNFVDWINDANQYTLDYPSTGSGLALTNAAFYTDSRLIAAFKSYISVLLNRLNPYNGLHYYEDPTIFCWETGNELQSPQPGATWTENIAAYIKSIAPNHLVMDGSGGGIDTGNLSCAHVDLYTNHFYPPNIATAQSEAATVTAANKVYLVGEYGWSGYIPGTAVATLDSSVHQAGSKSMKVAVSQVASDQSYAQVQQTGLTMVNGHTISYSFYAKSSVAGSIIGVVIQQNSGQYTVYDQHQVTLTTGWVQYSFSFTAPNSDSNVFIAFNLGSAATNTWFDLVSYVDAAGSNQIVNPSFESSTISPWFVNNTTPDSLGSFLTALEGSGIGDLFWNIQPHADVSGFYFHGGDTYSMYYPGTTSDMQTRAQQLRSHAYTVQGVSTPASSTPGQPLITSLVALAGRNRLLWRGTVPAATYTIEISTTGPTGSYSVLASGLADSATGYYDTSPVAGAYYRMKAYNRDSVAGAYSVAVTTPSGIGNLQAVAADVLQGMHAHAWNPLAKRKLNGVYVNDGGALYVNYDDTTDWSNPNLLFNVNNPLQINSQLPLGQTPINSHDPQVCLQYLRAACTYSAAYPADRSLELNNTNGYMGISTLIDHIVADFYPGIGYNNAKGWVYYALLEIWLSLKATSMLTRGIITQTQLDNLKMCVVNAAWTYYNNWYFPNYSVPISNPQVGSVSSTSGFHPTAAVSAGLKSITLTGATYGGANQGVLVITDSGNSENVVFSSHSLVTGGVQFTLATALAHAHSSAVAVRVYWYSYSPSQSMLCAAALIDCSQRFPTYSQAVPGSTTSQVITVNATAWSNAGKSTASAVFSRGSFDQQYGLYYNSMWLDVNNAQDSQDDASNYQGKVETQAELVEGMVRVALLIQATDAATATAYINQAKLTMQNAYTRLWDTTNPGGGFVFAFDMTPTGPGNGSTTLSTALVKGQTYTALAVNSTGPHAIPAGSQIILGFGTSQTQTVFNSVKANNNATAITMTSFVANANYAIGSAVTVASPQDSARVLQTYKETRSSALAVRTYQLLSLIDNTLLAQKQALLFALLNYFYSANVDQLDTTGDPGYYYKVQPNFAVYYNNFAVTTSFAITTPISAGDTRIMVPATASVPSASQTITMVVDGGSSNTETVQVIFPVVTIGGIKYANLALDGGGAQTFFQQNHAAGAYVQTPPQADFASTISTAITTASTSVTVASRTTGGKGGLSIFGGSINLMISGSLDGSITGNEEEVTFDYPDATSSTPLVLTVNAGYNGGHFQSAHPQGANVTTVINKNRESFYTTEAMGSVISDLLFSVAFLSVTLPSSSLVSQLSFLFSDGQNRLIGDRRALGVRHRDRFVASQNDNQ